MTTATVEGVEVDTRHWIGGERVASESAFTDISPIDEQPIAEISAGSAGRGGRRGTRRSASLSQLGSHAEKRTS